MPSFVELCVIATAMQALVTGVFLATFFVCLRWLVFSDDGKTLRKPIHRPFLTVAVALFVFSVTDLSLTLQTTLLIFKGYGGMLHTSRVITVRNSKINLHQVELSSVFYRIVGANYNRRRLGS